MAGNDKLRALDSALHQIEKDFGKGSIMRLGESAHLNIGAPCPWISPWGWAGFPGAV